MIVSISKNPPPFTVMYNGGTEFIIHKGIVVNAATGSITYPKVNGEVMTHAWTEAGSVIDVPSGSKIVLVVSHAAKEDLYFYEPVDILSAIITIGEPDELESETKIAIELASVEYEDTYSPTIVQKINSDVYLAILGQKIFI